MAGVRVRWRRERAMRGMGFLWMSGLVVGCGAAGGAGSDVPATRSATSEGEASERPATETSAAVAETKAQPAPAAPTADMGEACQQAEDCGSGMCEGEGCGDESPGHCVPPTRPCTRDLAAYCGCDGQTFRGSGSCPGRRFAHRGPCATQ